MENISPNASPNRRRTRLKAGDHRTCVSSERRQESSTSMFSTVNMLLGLAVMASVVGCPLTTASVQSRETSGRYVNRSTRRVVDTHTRNIVGRRKIRRVVISQIKQMMLHPHEESNDCLVSVCDRKSKEWVDCKLLTKFENKAGRVMCTVEYRLRDGEIQPFRPEKPVK